MLKHTQIQLVPSSILRPRRSRVSAQYLLLGPTGYLGVGTYEQEGEEDYWLLVGGTRLSTEEVTAWGPLEAAATVLGLREEPLALLDSDGYPTVQTCQLLESWPWHDPEGWMQLAHKAWYFPDFFQSRQVNDTCIEYQVSTAGWSGNEALIRAMRNNTSLWSSLWVHSQRGGHYLFSLTRED